MMIALIILLVYSIINLGLFGSIHEDTGSLTALIGYLINGAEFSVVVTMIFERDWR